MLTLVNFNREPENGPLEKQSPFGYQHFGGSKVTLHKGIYITPHRPAISKSLCFDSWWKHKKDGSTPLTGWIIIIIIIIIISSCCIYSSFTIFFHVSLSFHFIWLLFLHDFMCLFSCASKALNRECGGSFHRQLGVADSSSWMFGEFSEWWNLQ